MGVGAIKMDKILGNNGIPFYRVSTEDFDSRDFYVEVDPSKRQLRFYYTPESTNPVSILNCDDEENLIRTIPEVHERAFFGALSKLLKALNTKEFTEKMSYSA